MKNIQGYVRPNQHKSKINTYARFYIYSICFLRVQERTGVSDLAGLSPNSSQYLYDLYEI